MQIPAAGFIEIAQDQLRKLPLEHIQSQEKEFVEAIAHSTPDMVEGYQLGLQTARVLLETSPLLAVKGVKAEDVM